MDLPSVCSAEPKRIGFLHQRATGNIGTMSYYLLLWVRCCTRTSFCIFQGLIIVTSHTLMRVHANLMDTPQCGEKFLMTPDQVSLPVGYSSTTLELALAYAESNITGTWAHPWYISDGRVTGLSFCKAWERHLTLARLD